MPRQIFMRRYKFVELKVVDGVITPTGRRRKCIAESEKHARFLLRHYVNPPAFWAIKSVAVKNFQDVQPGTPLPAYFFDERRKIQYAEILRHCQKMHKHRAHAYRLPAGGGMRACDGTTYTPDWLVRPS